MILANIHLGRKVRFKARVHSGRGEVIEIILRSNGPWVIVQTKDGDHVHLRPSQITG